MTSSGAGRKLLLLVITTMAIADTAAAISVTTRDCQRRLAEIASGKMSGDDTPVLNDCLLNGLVSSGDVERAYKRAQAARS